MSKAKFYGKKISELSDEMLDHFKDLLSNESYLSVFNPRPSDEEIQKTADEIDSEIAYRETIILSNKREEQLLKNFLEWRKNVD